jgi:hypothetical protein
MSMPRSDLSRRALLAAGGALAVAPVANALRANPAAAAAPMLGRDEPTHYRFKLGDFEVTMIADSDACVDGPWPLIGGNTKQADVQQLMQEILIFDTGNGERGFVPRPAGGWLATQLAPAGIQPEQVDVVMLSHGHPDHIGGVLEKGKPLFPNARYVTGGSITTTGAATSPQAIWRNMRPTIATTSCPSPRRRHS